MSVLFLTSIWSMKSSSTQELVLNSKAKIQNTAEKKCCSKIKGTLNNQYKKKRWVSQVYKYEEKSRSSLDRQCNPDQDKDSSAVWDFILFSKRVCVWILGEPRSETQAWCGRRGLTDMTRFAQSMTSSPGDL